MKRLFNIAVTAGLQSLLPILLWIILSVVRKDAVISEGFTYTYPFQFIYILIFDTLTTGALKLCKLKQGDFRVALGVIITAFIIITAIGSLMIINMETTVSIIGTDMTHSDIIAFGILNLSIDIIPCSISKYLIYTGDELESFKLTIKYYLGRIPIAIILALAIENRAVSLISISLSFFILTMVLCWGKYLRHAKASKWMFNGVRYALGDMGYSLGMLVIYTFGINKLAQSAAMIASYNAYALCTDTQWDVLSSGIDTDATIDISEGRYKILTNFKRYVIYSLILLATSIVLMLGLRMMIPFGLKMAFMILAIECGLFPIYAFKYNLNSLNVIYANGVLMLVSTLITYIARTIVTVVSKSELALSWGVVTSCVIGTLWSVVIYLTYKKKIKVDMGNMEAERNGKREEEK